MIQDKKAKDLLNRVGEDVSQLRSDISSLINHTGRHALPDGARDLRDSAKKRLHAGGEFAVSQFRAHPAQSSAGLLGGLLVLGAVGVGIFYLCNNGCCSSSAEEEFEEEV